MLEDIVIGKTYKEHLKEVRARQFGYYIEPISPIDDLPSVTVEKPAKPKTSKAKSKPK